MLAFFNGALLPADALALSPADAGFVAGAAVTDYCRTFAGRLFRWPAHLARFRRHAGELGIPLPLPDDVLTAAAETLVRANRRGHAELAVISFATPGPLGAYTGEATDGPPTVGLHTIPVDAARERRFRADGVTLEAVGDHPGGWVGVKHRGRLHWWLAGKRTAPGAVGVLCGPGGVADTAVGGVLAVAGGVVIGPPPGAALESVTVGVVRELCGPNWREEAIDFRRPPASVTGWLLAGSGVGLVAVRRTVVGDTVRDWPDRPDLLTAWDRLVAAETGDPPPVSRRAT